MNEIGTITLGLSIIIFIFAIFVKPTSSKKYHSGANKS